MKLGGVISPPSFKAAMTLLRTWPRDQESHLSLPRFGRKFGWNIRPVFSVSSSALFQARMNVREQICPEQIKLSSATH
jgi:hypothetical protein